MSRKPLSDAATIGALALGALVLVTRRDRSLLVGRVHRIEPLIVATTGTSRRVRVGPVRSIRVVPRLPSAMLAMVSELQAEARPFTAGDIGISAQSFDKQPRTRWTWDRRKKKYRKRKKA